MTLEGIFETDCDGVGTGGAYYEELPHIYVSLPEADLAVFGIPLDEGWRPSKVKGYGIGLTRSDRNKAQGATSTSVKRRTSR